MDIGPEGFARLMIVAAALCGALEDKDVVDTLIRPSTSKKFLNHAATSTYGIVETASGIRQTKTALFTDFEIIRKSGSKKSVKTNMQTEIDYTFGWGSLHHESVMEKVVMPLQKVVS